MGERGCLTAPQGTTEDDKPPSGLGVTTQVGSAGFCTIFGKCLAPPSGDGGHTRSSQELLVWALKAVKIVQYPRPCGRGESSLWGAEASGCVDWLRSAVG